MSGKKRFYIDTNGLTDGYSYLEDRTRKSNDECDPNHIACAPGGSRVAAYLEELCDLLNEGHEATLGVENKETND